MTHLTLATIIRRRVPLTPQEAATVVLAIAAEWDRERTRDAAANLPDASAIRLHRTGDVSFYPRAAEPGSTSLSMLLGQLLGIDDASAPRQHVPGGLLMTIAGRLGEMDLPSRTEDGFRAALARFTDDDPLVLRTVFRRAARMCRANRHAAADAPASRTPERRRQPHAITELRRDLRRLERQVFDAIGSGHVKPVPEAAAAVPRSAWVGAALVACACVTMIALAPHARTAPLPDAVAAMPSALESGPSSSTVDSSPSLSVESSASLPSEAPASVRVARLGAVAPETRAPSTAARSAPAPADSPRSRGPARRAPVVHPRTVVAETVSVRRPLTLAPTQPSSRVTTRPADEGRAPVAEHTAAAPRRVPNRATFAGGTRGIAWLSTR